MSTQYTSLHELIFPLNFFLLYISKSDKVGFGTIIASADSLNGDEQLCLNCNSLTYGKYFSGYATKVQQPYDFFFKL